MVILLGAWNPLNKAVPGEFNGSGGHSKPNCLHDRANFDRAWQFFLIFNIAYLLHAAGYAIISADNGLQILQGQAIICTSTGLQSIEQWNLWNFNQNTTSLMYENWFEKYP